MVAITIEPFATSTGAQRGASEITILLNQVFATEYLIIQKLQRLEILLTVLIKEI